MDQHCEKHEFAISQQGTQITDLYVKFGLLATLPGKVDTQIEVLKELVVGMQSLSDHKAQIAVLCEIVADYKLHKTEYLKFKQDYSEFQIRAVKVDPEQVDKDHDIVTKMNAEWNLVKYVGPIVATGAGAGLGLLIDYIKSKVGF